MYFNVNFNVFFKLIKVHLLVSELYIYQNAWCNNKKKNMEECSCTCILNLFLLHVCTFYYGINCTFFVISEFSTNAHYAI